MRNFARTMHARAKKMSRQSRKNIRRQPATFADLQKSFPDSRAGLRGQAKADQIKAAALRADFV
jgi:hypothetical protein